MTSGVSRRQLSSSREGVSKPARLIAGMDSYPLVMVADPDGASAEGIRALRTHLLAQHLQLGRRALAVCSVNAGVGKTFIAANLAVSFAQIGIKTALINADMRSSGLNDYFTPTSPTASLVHFLQNESAPFGEAVTRDVYPNLSVIFSGDGASNAPELLGGARFRGLIDFCLRDYDLTIVDTPAAQASSDARRVSTLVGYSLIVAGKNSSKVSDIRTLLDQITDDHGKAIGTVLNYA